MKDTGTTARIASISRMQLRYWFDTGTSSNTRRKRVPVKRLQKLKASKRGRSPPTSSPNRSPWASRNQKISNYQTWRASHCTSLLTVLGSHSLLLWSPPVGDSIPTAWCAKWSAITLPLMDFWVVYWMLYSVKIICDRAILPERDGLSNMYLMESILEINKVVWVNIYCLSRRATHAKVQQVFSSSEYLVSKSVNFLLR